MTLRAFHDRLSVQGLAAERGGRLLFRNLSFQLEPGGMAELRGPNGAGKTTLLRVLAGLGRPADGAAGLEGGDTSERTHFVGHRNGLKAGLSVAQHAAFWARLLGDGDGGREAIAAVGLLAASTAPAGALSQGQARRLALARLLCARRPLWLLDEPAAGLDHAGKAMLAELICEHRERGGLVVAALHEPLGVSADREIVLG